MENKNHTKDYVFRILDILPEELPAFEEHFREFKSNYDHRFIIQTAKYNVVFRLETICDLESLSQMALQYINLHKIPYEAYGLWVSLIANNDHGGLTVPKEIAEFYRKTGGQLDYSFSFVDE